MLHPGAHLISVRPHSQMRRLAAGARRKAPVSDFLGAAR